MRVLPQHFWYALLPYCLGVVIVLYTRPEGYTAFEYLGKVWWVLAGLLVFYYVMFWRWETKRHPRAKHPENGENGL